MRRIVSLLLFAALPVMALVPPAASAATTTTVFPTATGSFGQSPTIKFPAAKPPSGLEADVLHKGSGPVIKSHDLLVVNYVGQIWKGKVFDSSYARGLFSIPIGVGQVIPGWDKALIGKTVGSRVMLVIPPADGYGSKGDSQAGIKGTDTLVFVIDLVKRYLPDIGGDKKATPLAALPKGILVNGKLGAIPSIVISKSAVQPTSPKAVVLDRGTGPKVSKGLVVLEIVVYDWTGKLINSTWSDGSPNGETVGDPSNPTVLDALVGTHLGSRVLVEIPKSSSGGPYALVIDVIAQPSEPKVAS